MYTAIKRFRHAKEGRNFAIYTDHKAHTYVFNQYLDKCSPRQFRHLDYIAQFTTNIRYIKVLDNNATDAVSRIEDIVNSGTYALWLKKIHFLDYDVEILRHVINEVLRPYVRNNLCKLNNIQKKKKHCGCSGTWIHVKFESGETHIIVPWNTNIVLVFKV